MSPQDAKLKSGFENEARKHLGKEFKIDVPVDEIDENKGTRQKFTYEMKSNKPISEERMMKAAGMTSGLNADENKIIFPSKSSKKNNTILRPE